MVRKVPASAPAAPPAKGDTKAEAPKKMTMEEIKTGQAVFTAPIRRPRLHFPRFQASMSAHGPLVRHR